MKKITALTLVFFFAIPLVFQVATVEAKKKNDSPITSPITTPITFFNLTGEVTIKKLGYFFKNAKRVMPAGDIVVKVRSLFDKNEKHSTTTDADGSYAFDLPKGHYVVEVKKQNGIFFVPPLRVVQLKEHQVKEVNFQGLSFY